MSQGETGRTEGLLVGLGCTREPCVVVCTLCNEEVELVLYGLLGFLVVFDHRVLTSFFSQLKMGSRREETHPTHTLTRRSIPDSTTPTTIRSEANFFGR